MGQNTRQHHNPPISLLSNRRPADNLPGRQACSDKAGKNDNPTNECKMVLRLNWYQWNGKYDQARKEFDCRTLHKNEELRIVDGRKSHKCIRCSNYHNPMFEKSFRIVSFPIRWETMRKYCNWMELNKLVQSLFHCAPESLIKAANRKLYQ